MSQQPADVSPESAVAGPSPESPSTPSTPHQSEPAEPAARTAQETLDPALRLPLHVNARGLALGIIATVSFVYALQWAQKFLIPVIFGIFIAYTLNPVVAWLEKLRLPRSIGATLVTGLILFGSIAVIERVQGEFESIVEELPAATHKLSRLIAASTGGKESTFQKMRAVANEIEQVAAGAEARRNVRRAAAAAEGPNFKVMDWVWAGSLGLVGFVSQATMVIFLVYFLLLSGDTFKRKLVKLTGPSLSRKKVTVHILEDINISIQHYMFMLLVTNVLLALLMWIALHLIGLENAGAWAIVAGLLHIMPYFGPLLITIATGLVAFLQFESLEMVLLVTATSMGIATLVGTFVTTWMTGRIARMNPTAVFISLLFWGWLWGVWGLLLGVPIIVIVKVVAERVQGMEVVAELLGE
ncbi:AI-2E family transporter [Janthinobacterium aquaticum]|uniref:AI-2E family transporter n=1 Tax=Janthinobacterium sp. FT58W TaxID=2654254 RepID=UPI001D01CAF1|nr:AI-2E family transporter [Janthinobacterium sp. FT58W]